MTDQYPKTYRQKRSLQDSAVNMNVISNTRCQLAAMKQDLDGIVESQEEVDQIMCHFAALEAILAKAKKIKLSFSSATEKDIKKLGIEHSGLFFDRKAISQRYNIPRSILDSLHEQLRRIFLHVMAPEHGARARIILDSVLLAVAETCALNTKKTSAVIFPEFTIGAGEGIRVINPTTKHEIWLTGTTDFALCTYSTKRTCRETVLLSTLDDVMRVAHNRITLVETKKETTELRTALPEATAQAVALAEVAGYVDDPFHLKKGVCVDPLLRCFRENATRVFYESEMIQISERDILDNLDRGRQDLHDVTEIVYHWLVSSKGPSEDPLFRLVEEEELDVSL
ncbi:hypothetical protein A0H81_04295 [Grifola frondosa]|uniref:Uncharacterized protein n=1 Tax=Grifola frondosa TaxID=5627 RepID=A0A1C7MET9_GRIFR|nr:hypothetical protein A0H81_04295 [Grifola frondosa]